ncbi:MAG: EAL domain-containing protein [Sulfurisoma sp.]|nr:EAL domain-containing protein [Sulfurisoma sp.]
MNSSPLAALVRNRRQRLALVLATALAAAGIMAFLIWSARGEALRGAATETRNLAWMLEARLDATLRRSESVLDELARDIPTEALRPEAVSRYASTVDARLDDHARRFPEITGLRIFDAQGDLLYTSNRAGVPDANIADRRPFRQLRDDPKLDFAISEVLVSRVSRSPIVAVARALRDPQGHFLGMATAPLDLNYFQRLLQSLDVGPNGVIYIRRSDDFTQVLRWPHLASEVNQPLPPGSESRELIAAGTREAALTHAHIDGVMRTSSFRALEKYPFYVAVAFAHDDVLASWQRRVMGVSLVALLLLTTLATLLTRLGRIEAHEAATEARVRLLAEVFEHSGEAIVVTDAANRIIDINASFTRLTGYAADEALGQNPRILSAGRLSGDDYRAMWQSIQTDGRWQGEVWDRRKDGSCYLKLLTISTLRDARGAITHHIGNFIDISERKAAEEHIHHLAHHDSLTGLPNRLSLRDRLDQAIAAARRDGQRLAVMFIDMDHFKAINDSLGHPIGDKLLVEVARRLKECVRDSDVVARLGGDEFVVVVTGIADDAVTTASSMAEKIQRLLAQPYAIFDHALHSTPSIGISVFPEDGHDVDALMKNADTAMYHAKSRGRNNFQFFTAAMNEKAAERQQLESSLHLGLQNGEFLLHFQPQVEALGGHVTGFEALARWNHPEKGLVPPVKFIPVAEETGLIEPLGDWVLNAACGQLRAFKELGWTGMTMAVNLSARQLRQPDLVERVTAVLAAFDLDGGELELEITESVAMDDPEATIGILSRLRAMGVRVAIDDFGTGYSSLAYLKRLPIDCLKLDRSFVMDIETDPNDAAICRASIALAHGLGLKVIAEGVETQAQYQFLKELGCDMIQGYYFSKPLPAEQIEAYLRGTRAAAGGNM